MSRVPTLVRALPHKNTLFYLTSKGEMLPDVFGALCLRLGRIRSHRTPFLNQTQGPEDLERLYMEQGQEMSAIEDALSTIESDRLVNEVREFDVDTPRNSPSEL